MAVEDEVAGVVAEVVVPVSVEGITVKTTAEARIGEAVDMEIRVALMEAVAGTVGDTRRVAEDTRKVVVATLVTERGEVAITKVFDDSYWYKLCGRLAILRGADLINIS